MKRRTTTALLALLGVLLAGCGRSPTPTAVAGKAGTPIQVDYRIDLGADAVGVKAEPDSVGLMFCVDVSGSMSGTIGAKSKIDIAKEALHRTVGQVAAFVAQRPKKKVLVGVIAFSDSTRIVHPLSPFDRGRLDAAIDGLGLGGGTAIGDAMSAALRELVKSGVERRSIIVMTDGENNRGIPPERVVAAIRGNSNSGGLTTDDTLLFLVAFDVNARVFDGVKQANAAVKEATDPKSLQDMLGLVTELSLE